MKKIRDAAQILGLLENGKFNPALSAEIAETTNKLRELSEESPSTAFKGKTTVILNFVAKDGMVLIQADFESKTPKRPRRTSSFWVLEDGSLSTEHPSQNDMFLRPVSRPSTDEQPPTAASPQ